MVHEDEEDETKTSRRRSSVASSRSLVSNPLSHVSLTNVNVETPPLRTTLFLPLPSIPSSFFVQLLIFVYAVSSADDLFISCLVSPFLSFSSLIDSSYSVAYRMDKRFSSSFLPSFVFLPPKRTRGTIERWILKIYRSSYQGISKGISPIRFS